jgi:starch-binding outer membrane protein, SusD/RagB family
LRYMDLRRWRAMDQMINTPYHVEGFKLWGPMKAWYTPAQLVYGASTNNAVVSDPSLSVYLRPHEIRSNADSYKGTRWAMAHYLSPIAAQHFIITSQGDVNSSPIYQNPGWTATAGSAPSGY